MNGGNRFETQMIRFEKISDQCLSSIEKKMSILISDGLTANYYIWFIFSFLFFSWLILNKQSVYLNLILK